MSPRRMGFSEVYRGFSVSMLPGQEREEVEGGGKIIMPPSALIALTRSDVSFPMLFKLTNRGSRRVTHCGVLEFIAGEDNVYLPGWMMHNLALEEGDAVRVESATLPVATYSKFRPLSQDFLDIYNPKAVLENTLRYFACLTVGDVINIKYNGNDYELSVMETEPENAVNIIECDLNVDFAPPPGYVEPQEVQEEEQEEEIATSFVPFSGEGRRVDGKQKKRTDLPPLTRNPSEARARGVPDYDWQVGSLVFMRKLHTKSPEKEEDKFQPFSGSGNTCS